MSIKHKIRQIEYQISQKDNGTDLMDLLSPNYKYKGEPFNSTDEILEAMNVIELPPYFTDEDIIRLFQNKLLSYDSPEMQEIQNKTIKEMKERM
jgi:hypothetical protein